MKRLLCLFLSVVFCEATSQSIANYNSIRNTSISYNSISATGSSFATWRNSNSNTQDDNRSDLTNIGFDFWYNGVRYTQFCASTNGFLDFSSSASDGGPGGGGFSYSNSAFTANNAANATRPSVAPFYDDLTAQGNVTALGNSLKYGLSGTAPNRTLTVEWINMAVFQNVSPSLNFQVQLVESKGIIKVNYGTMNAGTNLFSYSMGLNGPTVSFIPSTAQLKMLQTANSNSLSNTVQNNLSAMPAAGSQYVFTPPQPAAATGNITFTGVTQTGMTLNWTDWATNEVGYAIYNSTDGINYSFVTQTAAGATSSAITGLLPSTTYYWQVYAVTEGWLSTALSGSQITSPAGNKISATSGNWSLASTWTPTGVPTAGDNVTIATGHIVSINTNAQCNNLAVGQGAGGILQFTGNTARTLLVNSNITVNNNSTFQVPTSSNATHSVTVDGNMINNGTINFASDNNSLANSIFLNGNQTISGSGSCNFNRISVNLASSANTLEVTVASFSANANFLDLTSGTFKLSSGNAATVTAFSSDVTMPAGSGLCLNSANVVLNTGGSVTLYGDLTVLGGTLNIGNTSNEDLVCSGGSLKISAGAVNIAGKLDGSDINNTCSFNLSGGQLCVPTVGSTDINIAPFHISGAGSECNLTGGTIIIQREGGNGNQNLGFTNVGSSGAVVTGGTLQIGNASTPSGQIMDINSDAPVHNLLVSSANATARLNTNALTVSNNITIQAGALNTNGLDLTLGGSWSNAGTFTPGTGSVTFSAAAVQSIFKTGGETFNHLNFAGAGIKTFSAPVTANGNFSIAAGASVDVSAASHSLTVKGNLVNNGTLLTQSGLVSLTGTSNQNIGGSSSTDYYNLTLNNTAGALLTGSVNLLGTLTLSNGTFNTNSQQLTLVSTATATARIAQITGTGDITGSVTLQRYMAGGATGWALLGNPFSSALTLNDWDDDLIITCPTCPDGTAAGFSSIYTYNETVGGNYDAAASYVALSTINDAISTTKGYWVYLGTSQYTTTPITLDVTGSVRKFNYTIPLNYTNNGSAANDGWNLIYNPYPSAISWTALRGSTSNVDNAVYVYNADLNAGAGGFAGYVNGVSSPAVASGGVDDNIPMFQGFYVHSTGATGLSAKEANKVAFNPTFLRPASISQTPLLRLQLYGPNSFSEESVLYFDPNATNGFDAGYDAYKMRGQDPYAPYMALENGTDNFQISGIAPVNGNYSSALKTLTGYTGSYTLSAQNIGSFPNGACITLYDAFTSTTTDLKTSDYIFNLADTTTVARFTLNITMNSLGIAAAAQQPSCEQPSKGFIKVLPAGTGPWNYYWTSNGAPIQTSLNKLSADSIYNLSGGGFELEVNTVGMCDYNQSTYLINSQVPATAAFTVANTVINSLPAAVQFNNVSQNAATYAWDFGTGNFSQLASPVFTYTATGIYSVSLVATSPTGCSDTTQLAITVLNNALGIENQDVANESFILKNLDHNLYLVEALLKENLNCTALLTDMNGRLVHNFGVWHTGSALPVDLGAYRQGLYLLRIISEKGMKVLKLPVN